MKFNALLIDDNQMSLKAIRDMLDSTGSIEKIFMANNYFEAIKIIKYELENNVFSINLIFIDFDMSIIDGFEMLKNLQSIDLNDIFVVAISTNIQNKKISLQNGAVEFLHKPFGLDELQKVLDKISEISVY